MSVEPVPDDRPTIIPYLGVRGAARALDFYEEAFGAEEILQRIEDEQGRVGHAEIRIGTAVLYLADEHPEHGLRGPQTLGGSPVLFALHVEDVDGAVERAVAAGATLTRPVRDQFYGDRSGEVTDPFGYRWYLTTHVEDVLARRARRARESASG